MSEKDVVTLIIDGKMVRAPKGTAILEAAKAAGIHIPYYCYHPGLSVVGSCRMCLVEIEKVPKLQPSCATPVAEGMVVRTDTPETLKNRRSVLEYLLLNHPLDCPVCDQAGECELQNYYMDHGAYNTRFNEDKTKRKKAFPIGPFVILDQERCILCTRCVRFTREISRTGELGVVERGHRSEIEVFPGKELNNAYSANVVDICPVGALTDRDFRFQCRVWFLGRTPSICPGCSRGCNIEIHFNERFNPRYHDTRIQRLKPRYNKDVNSFWMCDEGRYSYHSIDAANRLKAPMLGQNGTRREVSWDEVVQRTARSLKDALDKHGPGAVALLASPQMTNEELFCLRRLFRELLKVSNIEFRVLSKVTGYSDDFLVTADKSPNSHGAEVLGFAGNGSETLLRECSEGRIHFLYICHHDLTSGHDPQEVVKSLSQVGFVAFQGSWDHPVAALADAVLPAAVYAETDGTFTNLHGRVQRIHAAVPPLGESMPGLDILARISAALGEPLPHLQPRDVFIEMSRSVAAFSGMTYETVGDTGQLLAVKPHVSGQ